MALLAAEGPGVPGLEIKEDVGTVLHPLMLLIRDYEWIHLSVGILGNATFLVGSVMFLSERWQAFGTWLFVVGSAGMLVGGLGDAAVKLARRRALPGAEAKGGPG